MAGILGVLLPCLVTISLWSDGTPDAVSHSLVWVSGAADQDGEDLNSGADLFYNVEENGYQKGISRPSVLPFIFLILICIM